jgi:hypothetical protein
MREPEPSPAVAPLDSPDAIVDCVLRLVGGRPVGGRPLSIRGRVVVLAGDTSVPVAELRAGTAIASAFAEIEATILSGGTSNGVAGLAAALGTRPLIRSVGYLPAGREEDADARYDEVRVTPGADFGVLEPLRAWSDLLASDIEASAVAVLGVGGGGIAAFEFRLALVLGARVGIVQGSGRAADALLEDASWSGHQRLSALRPLAPDIRRFVLDRGFTLPPVPGGTDGS